MKNGLDIFAKSIDLGQPAQPAQAVLNRNFLHSVILQHLKVPMYLKIQHVVKQTGINGPTST